MLCLSKVQISLPRRLPFLPSSVGKSSVGGLKSSCLTCRTGAGSLFRVAPHEFAGPEFKVETVTRSGACARSLLPCRAAPLSPAHCRTHHHAPAGAQMRAAHAGTTSWRDHNGVFVQIRRAVSPREVPGAWHTVRKVATCRVKKHAPHPW
jgi:hypothetical protein